MVQRPSPEVGLRVMCAGMVFVTLTFSALHFLVPLYAIRLGASPLLLGVLIASGHLLPMLVAMSVGRIVDRVGPMRILALGVIGSLVAPCAVIVTPSLATLAIAQIVAGLGQICLAVASQSLVASLGTAERTDRNFAWYGTALSVGQLLGPLTSGVIADLLGLRAAFAALVISMALTGSAVAVLYRLGFQRRGEARPSVASGLHQLRSLGSNVGLQVAFICSTGVLTTIGVAQAFLPAHLDAQSFSATSIGLLFSVRSSAAVLIQPVLPLVTRVLNGRSNVVVIVMLLVAVGIGGLGLTTSYLLLASLAFIAGLGAGASVPLSMAMIARAAPGQRGAALALRLTINRAAQLVTPIVMGLVVGFVGFGASFLIAGLGLLALTVLVVRMLPNVPDEA